jgi:Lamin Tail Domain/PEP-CTERM motif
MAILPVHHFYIHAEATSMQQKKYWLAGIAVLAIGIVAKNAPAALLITETMSSSGTGGTGDWFELTNNGAAAVNITGYKMDDNSFAFASAVPMTGVTSIGPGQSAVFIETADTDPTNQATAITAFRTFWGTAKLASVQVGAYSGSGVGLSSTADGVEVFDSAGNAVNQVSFAVATTGVSFGYNPTTSTFGGLSAAGQFGAFLSADPLANVGSPGAVPEPATLVLAGIGFGGMAVFVRRRLKARRVTA